MSVFSFEICCVLKRVKCLVVFDRLLSFRLERENNFALEKRKAKQCWKKGGAVTSRENKQRMDQKKTRTVSCRWGTTHSPGVDVYSYCFVKHKNTRVYSHFGCILERGFNGIEETSHPTLSCGCGLSFKSLVWEFFTFS